MALLCGIDIGTSATKALLCTETGKVLATANVEYPVYAPKPGWSEQEPDDWWKASVKVIGAVCRKARKKPQQIDAIGLSGQMHGSVFRGQGGQVASPRSAVERSAHRQGVRGDRIAGPAGDSNSSPWCRTSP